MRKRYSGLLFGWLSILTASVAINLTSHAAFGDASVCGNGIVEPAETCDPPGVAMPPNGNLCRADCTFCGDGLVNGMPRELCDDGNSDNFDGCPNTCVPCLCCGCIFDIAAARALIDAVCPCGSGAGFSRARYTECAGSQLIAALRAGTVRHRCSSAVRAYYLRSTCGRNPDRVPCVRVGVGSRVTCSIRAAARCTGRAMIAYPGYSHCLDALDAGNPDNPDATIVAIGGCLAAGP